MESVKNYFQQQSHTYEIIVVDGGSTDKTSKVVENFQKEQPQLKLITLTKNKGKGFAVRTGILHSKGRFVVFTDADLSTPIEEVEKIWPLLEKGYDVVICSRRHADSRIVVPQSRLRRFMGRIYNRLNRLIGIKDVQDVPCGFKGFRREAATQIFQTARLNGFSFDAEVLYLVQRKFHLSWTQIPIVWKNSSGSKIHLLKDPFIMILDLFKIKLYDVRGFYK